MKTYSVSMARANMTAILNEVQAGLVIQITRRGQPVAVIMSPTECGALERRRLAFREACADFRTRFGLDGLGLDREFFRALRDQRSGRTVKL